MIQKPKKNIILPFVLFISLIVAGCAIFSPILFQKYDTIDVDKGYTNIIDDDTEIYEYYYTTLNEDEQTLYKEFLIAISTYKERFTTKVEVTEEMASKVFPLVAYDHPELFWISSYQLNIGDKFTFFKMRYAYTEEEIATKMKLIKEKYEPILEEAKKLKTDKEKIYYVYDKLIEIGNYSELYARDREGFQSIVSIFTEGKTVCTGYTYGFKFLMDKLGIPSVSIEDKEKLGTPESHIWNGVKVGDEWKYLDITLRNPLESKFFFYRQPLHPLQENLPE